MTQLQFDDLSLAEPLLRALKTEQHLTPTPIQADAIPHLLAGRDLLGIAQTGTGKTAAFSLPILQKLFDNPPKRRPRCASVLILAPTRELALQIRDSLAAYGQNLKLRHTAIVGGVNQRSQVSAMAGGVDVLVATPGRLLDLIGQGHVCLDGVTTLVLDEADRMLDMGFIRDVRKIVAACPERRQSLLFAATMPAEVDRLASELLTHRVRVAVGAKKMTADGVTQEIIHVNAADKTRVLIDLMQDPAMARVIVFTRTKHGANRLSKKLQQAGIGANALHGNKSQSARQRALAQFRNGEARVLVATDIAARGIDVDDVTHVVNYELPNIPESYVHRIGRTARAGSAGIAVSLCAPAEQPFLRSIEKLTRTRIPVVQPGRSAPPASVPSASTPSASVPSASTPSASVPSASTPSASASLDQPARLKRRRTAKRPDHTPQPQETPAAMPRGTVKWFSARKGFGFIAPDDGGRDVFVHISELERAGLASPTEGQVLCYELQRDPKKGKMAAANVKAL